MSTAAPDCMRELLLHDMRTPLATISGYAQLLQRRAAKRVEQLLDALARLPLDDDVDHVQPRRTAVDLVALAARMSTYTYAPGRQRITVLPSVPELIGWWDCTRLEHVLMNLFSNALKYSPKDRDVLVTVQRSSDCAVLRVADQGVGIPPGEVCQIYEPGYRASKRGRSIPWHRYRAGRRLSDRRRTRRQHHGGERARRWHDRYGPPACPCRSDAVMSVRLAVRAHHEGAAAVAHELRLPLSHIKGFVTSLRRADVDWDEETRSEFLAEIDRETDRLDQFVESLLSASAPDSTARGPDLAFTDPGSVVEGALDRIRGLLGERSLRRRIPPRLPVVRMDASQMERVLANLLQNVIKYSPVGTPIGVSARITRRGELEFTIDDQGPGVPVADRARIFEPLFRKQSVETVERAWSRHWAGKSASPSFSRTAATCGSVSAVVAVRGSAFPPGANALRPGRARERWTG